MWQDKQNRLDTVPNEIANAIKALQPTLYNRVVEVISQLNLESGKIALSDEKILLLNSLFEEIRGALIQTDYLKILRGFAGEFDTQQSLINEYFLDTFEATPSALAAGVMQSSKDKAIRLLLGNNIDAQFIQPLNQILEQAVYSNAGWSDTLVTVRNYIIGNDTVDGRLLSYSKLVVSDTFAIADRTYTSIISNDLGIEWYRYTGGLIKDSRCFCQNRNGLFFHINEIREWGAGVGVDSCGFPWQGMARGTNEDTIVQYLGGYNCKHSAQPVSESTVPKADLLRAIEKGFYKPKAKTLQLLGL